MVDAADRADQLAKELAAQLGAARQQAAQLPRRPRVYFEEWDDPMISGIAWVSELIEVAGGIDIFDDRASGRSAKDRIVTIDEIIARDPEVIIGSWCNRDRLPSPMDCERCRTPFTGEVAKPVLHVLYSAGAAR